MDENGVLSNACTDDMPTEKRVCACQNKQDDFERHRPPQDEPVDRKYSIKKVLSNYQYHDFDLMPS